MWWILLSILGGSILGLAGFIGGMVLGLWIDNKISLRKEKQEFEEFQRTHKGQEE